MAMWGRQRRAVGCVPCETGCPERNPNNSGARLNYVAYATGAGDGRRPGRQRRQRWRLLNVTALESDEAPTDTRDAVQCRMFGVSSTANDGRANSPIEVP